MIFGQAAVGHLYALTVGGVNCSRHSNADEVHWSEIGAEGNARMEFTLRCPTGILPWSTAVGALQWLFILTAPEVYLVDTSAGRNLFGGNLVNVQRLPMPGPGVMLKCAAVSFDAWLDRRAALKWRSVTDLGGVVRKIANDGDIVQLLISKFAGFLLAPNTYVKNTNTNMPIIDFDSPTVAQQLGYIAEVAASVADPAARRFYVDPYKRVHYFKANESTSAPYRIGSADYVRTVKGTAGLVEMWPMRESSGATWYGLQAYANATLSGGYTQGGTPGLPNQQMMQSTALNGTSGFATATGANLHPGDVLSFEVWFKRGPIGAIRKLATAGANNDWEFHLTAANQIYAGKYGIGSWFQSSETVTDTTLWHHLVVTKNGATRAAYLDGVALTNTSGDQTVVASGGSTVNIGRNHAGSEWWNGSIAFMAIYNVALSAATALQHYQDGWTIVPDYIDYEDELNGAAQAAYVRGGNAAGSGWVYTRANLYDQTVVIDRPHVTTAAARDASGTAYLKREGAPVAGGKFIVSGFDGWRAGQTVAVNDVNIGAAGSFEIRNIEGDANQGSGNSTYEIAYGALPWRHKFDIQRKPRMRQWALA